MPLSCSCDTEDAAWYYLVPRDYRTYPVAARRKKCSSCGERIKGGAVCTEFERYRYYKTEVERKIRGEDGEIWLASTWLCEECSDLYFSFSELGYDCVGPWENMRELAAEYADLHDGGRPKNSMEGRRSHEFITGTRNTSAEDSQ